MAAYTSEYIAQLLETKSWSSIKKVLDEKDNPQEIGKYFFEKFLLLTSINRKGINLYL